MMRGRERERYDYGKTAIEETIDADRRRNNKGVGAFQDSKTHKGRDRLKGY